MEKGAAFNKFFDNICEADFELDAFAFNNSEKLTDIDKERIDELRIRVKSIVDEAFELREHFAWDD